MRCNPLYLVRHGNLRRLGSRKNLLRLFAMLAPATFSERRPGDGGQL
jgi:hypothetical protein